MWRWWHPETVAPCNNGGKPGSGRGSRMDERKERGCRNLTRSPSGSRRGSWEEEKPAARSVGGRWQRSAASGGFSAPRPGSPSHRRAPSGTLLLVWANLQPRRREGGREGSADCANDGSLSPSSALLLPAPRLWRVCFPSWIPLPFTSVRQTRANLPHSPSPSQTGEGEGESSLDSS